MCWRRKTINTKVLGKKKLIIISVLKVMAMKTKIGKRFLEKPKLVILLAIKSLRQKSWFKIKDL